MPERIRTRSLQLTFGGLLLLAIATTAHTGFLSKTPAATEPGLGNLSVPSFKLDPLPGSEATQEKQFASSTLNRWSADAVLPGQRPFTLEVVIVHNRTSSGLEINEMVRNAGLPAAEHEVQSLETDAGKPAEEVAIAEIGSDWVLRTCITPKGRALITDLKKTLHAERPTGATDKVLQALGLQDNIRWECMLVSISAPKSEISHATLLVAWNDLKAPLLGWSKTAQH